MPDIKLKIVIDGKEAQAVLKATDEEVRQLYGNAVRGARQTQKETGTLTQFIREQRAENRQQNFLLREGYQAVGALSLAVTAFGEAGDSEMRKLTQTVGQGILAFQGFNFALGALGVGGPLGLALASIAALSTMIGGLSRKAEDAQRDLERLKTTVDEFSKSMQVATREELEQSIALLDENLRKTDAALKKLKEDRIKSIGEDSPFATGYAELIDATFGTEITKYGEIGAAIEALQQIRDRDAKMRKSLVDLMLNQERSSVRTADIIRESEIASIRDKFRQNEAEARANFEKQKKIIAASVGTEQEKTKAIELAERTLNNRLNEIRRERQAAERATWDAAQANLKTFLEAQRQHSERMLAIRGGDNLKTLALQRRGIQQQIAELEGLGVRTVEQEQRLMALKEQLAQKEVEIEKRKHGMLEQITGEQLERRRIDLEQNEFTRQRKLADLELKLNQDKYGDLLIFRQQHAAAIAAIDQAEMQSKIQTVAGAIQFIAGAVGRYTVLGKAAAIFQATINTYEAATKALTAGPIIGPILAAVISAIGFAQVANIAAQEPPRMAGFALGGIVVGERGPEILAPMQSYAEGKAQLISAAINAINAQLRVRVIEAPGGIADLKKEFVALRKQIKKLKLETTIIASTDISKFDKVEKKLQRARAALEL